MKDKPKPLDPAAKRIAARLGRLADSSPTIEGAWRLFAKVTLPDNAPQHQRESLRVAFFAGAEWSLTKTVRSSAELSEDDACKVFDSLFAELRAFARELGADVPEPPAPSAPRT